MRKKYCAHSTAIPSAELHVSSWPWVIDSIIMTDWSKKRETEAETSVKGVFHWREGKDKICKGWGQSRFDYTYTCMTVSTGMCSVAWVERNKKGGQGFYCPQRQAQFCLGHTAEVYSCYKPENHLKLKNKWWILVKKNLFLTSSIKLMTNTSNIACIVWMSKCFRPVWSIHQSWMDFCAFWGLRVCLQAIVLSGFVVTHSHMPYYARKIACSSFLQSLSWGKMDLSSRQTKCHNNEAGG